MMGIAAGEEADYVDQLDLYHTREMFMTWYPTQKDHLLQAAVRAAAASGAVLGPVYADREGASA
ncbi:MAG: hypothetical protein ABS909_06970, partial [Arthrobacter sp.]